MKMFLSNRYNERGGAFRSQDDTAQPSQRMKSESRHPRERYQDGAKGMVYEIIIIKVWWYVQNTSLCFSKFH